MDERLSLGWKEKGGERGVGAGEWTREVGSGGEASAGRGRGGGGGGEWTKEGWGWGAGQLGRTEKIRHRLAG